MVEHVTQHAKLDSEKAIAWLDKHWQGKRPCPICTNYSWSIGDEMVEVRAFLGGSLSTGVPVYPLTVVTCDTCGHTLLFNAKVAGLVEG